jgi:serine/threonine protein kinase
MMAWGLVLWEQQQTIFLVTELCVGGELYDRVVEKTMSDEKHFSEYDAARIIRNILEAIQYCHDEKGVAHRGKEGKSVMPVQCWMVLSEMLFCRIRRSLVH